MRRGRTSSPATLNDRGASLSAPCPVVHRELFAACAHQQCEGQAVLPSEVAGWPEKLSRRRRSPPDAES
eukprot:5845982-Pyramimonas_sp.AAC.1